MEPDDSPYRKKQGSLFRSLKGNSVSPMMKSKIGQRESIEIKAFPNSNKTKETYDKKLIDSKSQDNTPKKENKIELFKKNDNISNFEERKSIVIENLSNNEILKQHKIILENENSSPTNFLDSKLEKEENYEETEDIVNDLPEKIEKKDPTITNTQIKNSTKKSTTTKIILSNQNPKERPVLKKKNIPVFNYDDYKLLELLGEGGFGKVFKAYNKRTFEFLALKFFKDPQQDDFDEIANEDYLLKQIDQMANPRFLKYYGLYKDPLIKEGFLLVMESGEMNLKEVLAVRKKYEFKNIIFIFHSLLLDFISLQKNGISTRDVKTENVILANDNKRKNSYLYKISDFGIGCVLPINKTKISSEDCTGCTAFYAAPEVKLMIDDKYNEEEYDPFKSDVYSLAITIIELLGFKTKEEYLKNIEDPLFPILNSMLENDPLKRPDFNTVLKKIEVFIKKEEEPKNENHFIELAVKERENNLSPEKRISKLLTTFYAYRDLTYYKKAQEILEKCFEIYNQNIDRFKESNTELQLFRENGRLLREYLNKYSDSLIWTQKYMGLCKKLYGESSKESAEAFNEIAKVFDILKDFGNAESNYLSALVIRETIFGPLHPETATSYNSMAFFCQKVKQDYSKAEEYFLKALNIYERKYGQYNSHTAICYNNLALFYKNVKQEYVKAEQYYLKALQAREKVFGELHVDTATSYNNLALFYKSAKKDNINSEKYFIKAMKIRESVLGEEHLLTAQSYSNLASFYLNNKIDYDEAEKYFLKELNILEKMVGEEHDDVAKNYNNLANFYQNVKKELDKAESYYIKTINYFERNFGKEHDKTCQFYVTVANFYVEKKEIKKALGLLEKAFVITKKIYGDQSQKTAKIKNILNKLQK